MSPEALTEAYTAAWNSGRPEAVAAFHARDGLLVINSGPPLTGRDEIAAMAAAYLADMPDLALTCDGLRVAGSHIVYLWAFTGTDTGSGRPLRVSGWEEWDIGADGLIAVARGWFDAADYDRQLAGG